jgi:hypothetical protein
MQFLQFTRFGMFRQPFRRQSPCVVDVVAMPILGGRTGPC